MASLNVKCSNDRLLLKFEGKAERNDVDLFQALFMKTTEKTFLKSHTHTHTDRKTLSLYSRQCQPIRRLITLTNSPDTSARSGIPDIPGDTRAETKTMADDHSLDV